MDCYCTNRKSNKDEKIQIHNAAVTKYWTEMKKIESVEKLEDGSNIQIECSYLLCGYIGDKPLVKQAVCRNIPHYFCSEDCWAEWVKEPRALSKHDFYSPTLSPLIKSNSPKYMKYFNIINGGKLDISKIPSLSI